MTSQNESTLEGNKNKLDCSKLSIICFLSTNHKNFIFFSLLYLFLNFSTSFHSHQIFKIRSGIFSFNSL
ncbi:hypothetical protein HOF65_04115 [bacterium]|nr:hypothetical protein [bacterium]